MMFAGVALFGAATVVFGLSSTPWVSIAALVVMGAADMVSVYVRETLIALWTPDKVRGRVNAVNMVFVGASNELGEFHAGSMASVFGAVHSVVIGGIGTLMVAAIWAARFPKLRKIDSLEAPEKLGRNDRGSTKTFRLRPRSPNLRHAAYTAIPSRSSSNRPWRVFVRSRRIRDCGSIPDRCGWISSRSMRRSSGHGISSLQS